MGILAASRAGIDCICIPDMKVPAEEYRRLAFYSRGFKRGVTSLDKNKRFQRRDIFYLFKAKQDGAIL